MALLKVATISPLVVVTKSPQKTFHGDWLEVATNTLYNHILLENFISIRGDTRTVATKMLLSVAIKRVATKSFSFSSNLCELPQ